MKVKFRKKPRALRADEARVITINEDAIAEVLSEFLLENKNDYFDLPEDVDSADDVICVTNWNRRSNLLTCILMHRKFFAEGFDVNINAIIERTGITTDSLYKEKRYKTVVLSEEHGTIYRRNTEDGSMC